jgi:hypothetical protein
MGSQQFRQGVFNRLPRFRVSWSAAVKDVFVVGFFTRAEQVVDNLCEFMSCGADYLGFAELPSDTPRELAELFWQIAELNSSSTGSLRVGHEQDAFRNHC